MVSVDELIIRCGEWHGPPPGVDYGAPGAISVGSLLRREGRAPHAVDRALQPRGHSRPPEEPPMPPRRNVRKATAAAGALFAAGAMFATAVVENVVRSPGDGVQLGIGGDTPGPDGPAGGGAQANRGDAPRNLAFSVGELFTSPVGTAGSGSALASLDAGSGVFGSQGAGGATAVDPFDVNLAPSSAGGPALAAGPDAAGPGATTPGGGPGAPVESGGPGVLPGIGIGPITLPVGGGAEGGPGGGPGVVIPVPGLGTPGLEVPAVDVPGGALPGVPVDAVRTPRVGVSPAQVRTPDIVIAGGNGQAGIAVSDTALATPDVTVSEVQAGPLRLAPAEVGLPDVAISEGGATLSRDGARVAVPEVSVSETTLVTPDVQLGRARVALPDAALPELTVPRLTVDTSDPAGTVEDAASAVVSTVDQVGTGVVGAAADVVDETVDSVGETLGSLTGAGRAEGSAEESGRSADDSDSRDSGSRDSDSDSDSDSSDSGLDLGLGLGLLRDSDSDSGDTDSDGDADDRDSDSDRGDSGSRDSGSDDDGEDRSGDSGSRDSDSSDSGGSVRSVLGEVLGRG